MHVNKLHILKWNLEGEVLDCWKINRFMNITTFMLISFRGGQIPNHGDSQSRLRADIYNLTAKENMLDELIRNAG